MSVQPPRSPVITRSRKLRENQAPKLQEQAKTHEVPSALSLGGAKGRARRKTIAAESQELAGRPAMQVKTAIPQDENRKPAEIAKGRNRRKTMAARSAAEPQELEGPRRGRPPLQEKTASTRARSQPRQQVQQKTARSKSSPRRQPSQAAAARVRFDDREHAPVPQSRARGRMCQDASPSDGQAGGKLAQHTRSKSKPVKNLCYVDVPPLPERLPDARRRCAGGAVTSTRATVVSDSTDPTSDPDSCANTPKGLHPSRDRPRNASRDLTPWRSRRGQSETRPDPAPHVPLSQHPRAAVDVSGNSGLVALLSVIGVGVLWALLSYYVDPDAGFNKSLLLLSQLGS